MAKREYKKLCGGSLSSTQSAWLGRDHLLLLDGRFKEVAKRLRFADVEATLICPTKSGKVVGLLTGLGGFFFLIVALANASNDALWGWLIMVVASWVVFAWTLYQRGTAVMGVQTAVQTVVLEGVRTLRKARKVERMLSARIEAEQGVLSLEELRSALQARREAARLARERQMQAAPPWPKQASPAPPPLRTGAGASAPQSETPESST